MKHILLFFAFIMAVTAVNAQLPISYTLSGPEVEIENGCITSCKPLPGLLINLTIPKTIYKNGQAITITSIADNVFSNKNLISLTLANSLISIGENAFANNYLVSVTLSEALRHIGKSAFYGNSNLTSINLPKHTSTPGFEGWIDGFGDKMQPDENGNYILSNTFRAYAAILPYTLTDDDVEVVNGHIVSCKTLKGTKITIPQILDGQTVTDINGYQFARRMLVSVNLPNSIINIGSNAFLGNSLTSITLPEGVLRIGAYAFAFNNLTSVTLGETIISIGENAFAKNNDLLSINLPKHESTPGFEGWIDSNRQQVAKTEDGNYPISNFDISYTAIVPYTLTSDDVTLDNEGCIISCKPLTGTKLYIPKTLNKNGTEITITGIGLTVFSSRGLMEITLPNSVTSISESSFFNNSLTNLILPEGLISIGESAFSGNKLTEVTFPNSLTSIGKRAFYNNNLTSVKLSESLTFIDEYAFYNNPFASMNLPKHAATPGFTGWVDGMEQPVPLTDNNYTVNIFSTSYTAQINSNFYTLTAADITVDENGVITSCNITDFNTKDYAFGNIVIPQTINKEGVDIAITGINDAVFMLRSMASVVVPEGVKSIGDKAFYSCHLTSVTLPEGLQSIGSWAFGYNDLTSVTLPNGLLNICDYAFTYNKLTSVTLSGTLIIIDESAFANNTNLTSINLPRHESTPGFEGWIDSNKQKVTKTEEGNYTISNFYVPYYAIIPYTLTADDVTIDNEGCIVSCNILKGTKLTIPQTLNKNGTEITITGIGNSVFENRGLVSVVFPHSITSIGKNAFEINNIASITLPSSLTSIEYRAFAYNWLTSITLSETVTSIGESAFSSNFLTSVTLSEKLVSMGENAFAYNGNLASVNLPKHDATPGFTGWKDGNGSMVPLNGGNYTVNVFTTSYTALISDRPAPAAPTLAGKTHNTITLNAVEGCEYSMDGGTNWQSEVLFDGLEINTTYTFVQRYFETNTDYASPASEPLTVVTDKAQQATPAAPTLASKTQSSITLNAVEGCEYSMDGSANWQSEVLFDGLEISTAYTFVQRYFETNTDYASPASEPLTVVTDKAQQAAPAAPTLASKTENSITLNAVTGCEYSIDGGATWQSEVLFDGLEINTTYTFVQRYFETNTDYASPASEPLTVVTDKTQQAAPAAPTLASKTENSITLNAVTGCEYSIDGGATWQSEVLFDGLESGTSYTLLQRYAKTNTNDASPASEPLTVVTDKAQQAAPAAPTLAGKTDSSIVLNVLEGCEYSIDNGTTWQDTPLFKGLDDNTEYMLIQRYAETATSNASPASKPLMVTTDISTAIDELETGSIKLYPNPASHKITIANAPEGSCLIIYNISGGIVLQTIITDNLHPIDISALNTGVYLVQVGTITQKLVVRK
ncbi:T9SS C-terminal target domain-containing protein [Mariniphaga sediminis]|uniref:T9SS C-terminal target domain-containing protein n=1 Tax=Mariniphaga sediminis TaxID=1628158 RepID=A0A399CXG7_9BACT|nr:leucine-rich repeat protein [Mariniphaga sediminis]RIH64435.1 T9SS C-terminal target domain-containing protein [Mariniphaga sediminis]